MNMPVCPTCGAELGPWEGESCVRHGPTRPWTIADQAVLVLEAETAPLYLHDIRRGIEREIGRATDRQSVASVVGADRRFCWSGKGLYSLFRHGRIPGVRTLADTAGFILLAAQEPLGASEIAFLMKWSGYRFQDTSLEAALNRDSRFASGWEPRDSLSGEGWKVRLQDPDAERKRMVALRVPLPGMIDAILDGFVRGHGSPRTAFWPVDTLIDRWHGRVVEGIAERSRRLQAGR